MGRRRRRRYSYSSSAAARRLRAEERFQPVSLGLAPETKRGIAIVGFLLVSILSGLAIFGLAGEFGDKFTQVLALLFGSAVYATPLIFFGVCLSLFLGVRLSVVEDDEADEDAAVRSSIARSLIGAALFVFAVTGMLHVSAIEGGEGKVFDLVKAGQGGGYLGVILGYTIYSVVGYVAAQLILASTILISILVTFNWSIHAFFRAILRFLIGLARPQQEEEESTPRSERISSRAAPIPASGSEQVKINTMESAGFAAAAVSRRKPPTETEDALAVGEDGGKSSEGPPAEATGARSPKRFSRDNWKLPPTDLLDATTSDVQSGNIEANVKIIKKTLSDFGVHVEMGEVNVGPTVTQYTFRPAVGVKVSQILGLQNDLALALAAPSIRVEAPIPGQSLVGIEVPNKSSATVRLRELIESDAYRNHPSNLAFILGRDVAGHPIVADLGKMPHLLIAGASGMGKSVCINDVLTSFLYRNSPSELRLIVIDPKRVELTLYNGIPHLLTPVVIDHKQAVNALRWMVAEMDRRYKLLSEVGKRNIEEFNASHTDQRLPYLVLVVDELADLMAVAQADVEAAIVRLAQMARAVGLHLILATQRPSVNIITGLIKANITSRIAFAVASQVDSRTILDMAGAERLLGNGDMLYTAANLPKPKRIQSPYIGEKEVRRVVDFLKAQAEPEYQEEILERKTRAAGVGGEGEDEDDEVINAAIEEIRRSRKASASFLQRRLSLGYARAARVLDILEQRGIVGPADGAKPREVYLDAEESEVPPELG